MLNPSLYKKLPYDPVKDFAPISNLLEPVDVITVNAAPSLSGYSSTTPTRSASFSATPVVSGGATPSGTWEIWLQVAPGRLRPVPFADPSIRATPS